MAICEEIEVSLRIFGDDLEPVHISAALGKEPSLSRKKGDLRIICEGKEPRISKTGTWIYSVKTARDQNFDDLVLSIFDGMTDNISIWDDLTSQYDVDLFVGVFLNANSQGLILSSDTLELLASRKISIDLDIYCTEEKSID